MAQIEAVRVVQDAAYAAGLSDQDWIALSQDPAWQEMVSEQSEMVAGVIAQYGNKLPGGGQSSAPTATGVSKDFTFVTPMGTIEDFDPFEANLKKRDGILAISGNERSVTIKWDPAKLDEAKVRGILSDLGRPVR